MTEPPNIEAALATVREALLPKAEITTVTVAEKQAQLAALDAIASELERLRQINSDVVDVNTEACNRADAAEAELERVRAERDEIREVAFGQTALVNQAEARLDRAVEALRYYANLQTGESTAQLQAPARAALDDIGESA